ncbi:MAG: hypothetical protein L0Z55_01200 [Planctomycetes bacterium]|nr:hypothetical protein [Planctomycetota bacterium]
MKMHDDGGIATPNNEGHRSNGGATHYRAYGITIASEIDLPELPRAPAGAGSVADLTIRLGTVDASDAAPAAAGSRFWIRGGDACHAYKGAGAFLARAGAEIIVDPLPGVAAEVIRLSLLGPVLALALHQRGLFLLHASAVAAPRGTGAIVLAGASGAGKSTAAALLCRNGYALVADDVTALAPSPAGVQVLPGYPQCKLWRDAYEALGYAEEELAPMNPAYDKRALRTASHFCAQPLPLGGICILDVGEQLAYEAVPPQQGFAEVMRNWYGARFGSGLFQALDRELHLRHAAAVAASAPIVRLTRPRLGLADPAFGGRFAAAIARAFAAGRPA